MAPPRQPTAYAPPQLTHAYGPQVHLLADPLVALELARMGAPECRQPELSALVRSLYRQLVRAYLAASLPLAQVAVPTRMQAIHPAGVWHGQVPQLDADAVVVDIARAGTVPAQATFELLCQLFDASRVRQDHVSMARALGDDDAVVGATLGASKLGGPAAGARVLIPDPMGATGHTMVRACTLYKELAGGAPAQLVALHLIVTPEYVRRMAMAHPDVAIWALRLDRGLSAPDILATPPGQRWDEERGLNERHYIVPGAGGLGEALNNTPA